jgi:hypothetical protein
MEIHESDTSLSDVASSTNPCGRPKPDDAATGCIIDIQHNGIYKRAIENDPKT